VDVPGSFGHLEKDEVMSRPLRSSQNRDAVVRKPISGSTARSRTRSTLSRETLLEAGLGIARREDLGKLTLKKLADEFGVTPMAVYRHFRNKAEIIDGVLDLFVREAAVTEHEGAETPEDWRRWIRLTFHGMRRALLETPSVIPFLGTSYSFGPGAMAVLEQTLAVLRRAGLSERAAVEAFLTLAGYTIGAVGFEAAWRRAPPSDLEEAPDLDFEEQLRQSRLRFESARRSSYPNLVELAPQLAEAMGEFPFEQGLDRILESLERELDCMSSKNFENRQWSGA
jgi:AcrR family transcriptional regulator